MSQRKEEQYHHNKLKRKGILVDSDEEGIPVLLGTILTLRHLIFLLRSFF